MYSLGGAAVGTWEPPVAWVQFIQTGNLRGRKQILKGMAYFCEAQFLNMNSRSWGVYGWNQGLVGIMPHEYSGGSLLRKALIYTMKAELF